MKNHLVTLTAALCLAVCACAESKEAVAPPGPGGAVVGAAVVSATVEAIDYKSRNVTLKKDSGELISFVVGEAARNFDQVKIGDRVKFEYLEALAIDVRKDDGSLDPTAEVAIARAPKGQKPKGVITETVTLKAIVEEIDYTTRYVTLKGPRGNMVSMKVGEQATRFNEVKKGDQVVVQYTEALGISVTSPQG